VASLGLDVRAMHGGVRLRVDGRSRAGDVQVPAVGYELTLNAVQLAVGDDTTASVLLDEAEANHEVTLPARAPCRHAPKDLAKLYELRIAECEPSKQPPVIPECVDRPKPQGSRRRERVRLVYTAVQK
jgi:hypothetical protein